MLHKLLIRLRNRKLFIITIFSCLLFILGSFSFAGANDKSQHKVIRVGYYSYDNLSSVDGNNGYSGYDYELLKDISEYTGWEYQFVYGTLSDCLTRLENGEIDLIANLHKTNKRKDRFEYSENHIGIIYPLLWVNQNRDDVHYEDFTKFEGMKVGILRENGTKNPFDEYAERHNFRVHYEKFYDLHEMIDAMQTGQVDAIITGSFTKVAQGKVVARLQAKPGFFLAQKGNEELIKSIDNACNKIFAANTQYREDLRDKYYAASPAYETSLTREEMEFIKGQPVLKVAYEPKWQPIAYYDVEEGIVKGIAIDFFRHIAAKTGLKFEFIEVRNKTLFNTMSDGEADVICGYDTAIGDSRGYKFGISKPYIQMPLSFISMKGNVPAGIFKVGIAEGSIGIGHNLERNFPQAHITNYQSLEEAIEAMREGEIDFVVDNTYILQKYLQEPGNENQRLLPFGNDGQYLCFGLSYNRDQKLLSIFNKVMAGMRPEERNHIIASNIAKMPYHLNFNIFAKKYHYQIFASIVFLLLAFLGYFYLMEKRKEKELEKIAFYDRVTGARNFERFQLDAAEPVRNGGYVIVMFDVNHFRAVTTGFGPREGQRLLRLLCDNLARNMHENELFAHGSNDLFLLLLQDDDNASIRERLLKLQESIKAEILHSGALYNISLAFGVYRPGKDVKELPDILEFVDLARLEAKKGYSGGIVFYEADLGEKIIREAEIENKMEHALQKKEFIVYYQPKYDLKTERPAGAEALVRWQSGKGMIMPSDFIDLFERNGFILKLDLYVFEQVCIDIRRWLDEGRKVLPISVNVSRVHLFDPDFVEKYSRLIAQYRIPSQLLEFELTENMPLASEDFLLEIFNDLSQLGVKLVIDDFGSGYSSLNTLHNMPFDTIKIDQRFFQDKTSSARGRRIIETIVFMAQKLGMGVVAEGVETKEHVDFLKSIGCNWVQGYYFAKPMPANEFEHLLYWEINTF